MTKTPVYKWINRFSNGRKTVTDHKRSEQPLTCRNYEIIVKVCHCVKIVNRLSWELAQQVKTDKGTVRKILKAEMVPK